MTTATNDKDLEENLREAKDLSRALWYLMAGIIEKSYPHAIGKDALVGIYQLATEIRDRTEAADEQWHAEA